MMEKTKITIISLFCMFFVRSLFATKAYSNFYKNKYQHEHQQQQLGTQVRDVEESVIDSNKAVQQLILQNDQLLEQGDVHESLIRKFLRYVKVNKKYLLTILFLIILTSTILFFRTRANKRSLGVLSDVLQEVNIKIYKNKKNYSKINIYLVILVTVLFLCLLLFLGKFIF